MVKLLLIGNGTWGQKYISTLSSNQEVELTIGNRDNWKKSINQKPDGVIVCTPPQSHVELASYALRRQIPVMIEKPLSLSLAEAESLNQYSSNILVNHIHLFSSQYQDIKKQLKSQKIINIQSIGLSNSPQRDYSELWDYGPHDISLILDFTQQYPISIKCKEVSPRCFSIVLEFDHFKTISIVGHTIGDRKRFFSAETENEIFEYDGLKPTESPPLTNALEVFIKSIKGYPDYRLGLDLSLQVMRVLEDCQNLLSQAI